MKTLITETRSELITKICSVCKTQKPLDAFYKYKTGNCYGQCKACWNIKAKTWSKENPDRVRVALEKYTKKFKRPRVVATEKTCTACQQIKSIDQFFGSGGKCKICRTAQCKQWVTENRDKARAYSRNYQSKDPEARRIRSAEYRVKNRDICNETVYRYRRKNPQKVKRAALKHALKKRYALSIERYEELLAKQDWQCAACQDVLKDTDKKGVDHCHNTGLVRGILCVSCNFAEGLLKTPRRAFLLYEYMTKNELFYYGSDAQTNN